MRSCELVSLVAMCVVVLSRLPEARAAELRHMWTFNDGTAEDEVGDAHGILEGEGIEIIDGRLFLEGRPRSRMITDPIGEGLEAKTMVAWASPATIQQRGGSVLTIEDSPSGDIFDAIVAFERVPGQWMAGSNFFQRSVPENLGIPETATCPEEVMIAIVYDVDNSITIYRNDEIYADSLSATQGVLQPFDEFAVVQIGARHGGHPDVFQGFVNEARIYSGALDADEIADIFDDGPTASDELTECAPQGEGPCDDEDVELLAQWTFNDDTAEDSVADADGFLEGDGIEIIDGRLRLNGSPGSRMITAALGEPLCAKTLVAWASPDTLGQRGGSILTIEDSPSGQIFDAIVAFERVPGQWMAGSNFFQRSVPDNGGPAETETCPEEVMLAIVYDSDNSITIYRNDEVYSPPENASQGFLQPFDEFAVAQIGARHGSHNDVFSGFVNEARIYRGALSADEVAEIFAAGPEEPNEPLPDECGDSQEPEEIELRHLWTFNEGTEDLVGDAHGTLEGGATIVDERLSLDGIGGSRMLTEPLGAPLLEKTLVAWVSPNDLFQKGGSVLTVEDSPQGNVFDGIVAFERIDQQWIAGSNGFARTVADNGGPPETVVDPEEVMLAIVYDAQNQITIYRDGEVYAPPELASKGTLQRFDASSVAQIGPRHGPHPDVFNGFVNEARTYSGALNAEEIEAIFEAGPCDDDATCLEVDSRPNMLRGDSNGDAAHNITDSIYTLNNLFGGGPTLPCNAAGDANGDGGINISDAAYSLNFLFAAGSEPPSPFPDCGPVTDADLALGCETSLECP